MSERSTYFYFVMTENQQIQDIKVDLINFCKVVTDEAKFSLVNYTLDYDREERLIVARSVDIDDFVTKEVTLAKEADVLEIDFEFIFRSDIDMDITLSLDFSHRLAISRVNYNFFEREDAIFPMLHFYKSLHQLPQSLYGYGITGPTDVPNASFIDTGKVETLYSYNFLGPKIISVYGSDKIHSLPAWQMKIYQMVEYLSQWISIPLRTGNSVDPTTKKRLNYWVFLDFNREDKTSSDPEKD